MAEVSVPLAGCAIELDVCTGCQFVWFDAGEVEQLPAAPRSESAEARLARLPAEAREAMALAEVRLAERSAEARERLEGETPDAGWQWIAGFLGMPVEKGVDPVAIRPWATWSLAGAMVAIFALTVSHLDAVVEQFGFVPDMPLRHAGLTLVSAFFLHGGLWHLVGNTYFLLVFGDNVEEYLGWWRYLLLILLAALAGDAAHFLADPRSSVPCIGASGGISGVITFYALQFPSARIGFLPRFGWVWLRWVFLPAWGALVLWLGLQLLVAYAQISGAGSVSGLAHLGGTALGALAWLAWRRN